MTETASKAQESDDIFDNPPETEELPRTNGSSGTTAEGEDRPTKRRRVSEGAPTPRRKPESPPWKKVIAEGPSFFTQDGKRKSGRTNPIPLELQPPSDKRQTRRTSQNVSAVKSKYGSSRITSAHQAPEASTSPVNTFKKLGNGASNSLIISPGIPSASPPKRAYRRSLPNGHPPSPVSSRPKPPIQTQTQSKNTHGLARAGKGRRAGRVADTAADEEPMRSVPKNIEIPFDQSPKAKLAKIRFRIKPASLPFPNPGQVLPRPQLFSTLQKYLEGASNIDVKDGGLYSEEEPDEYLPKMVAKDALSILQTEDAVKPGGLLSREVCSIYEPEEQEGPPAQYAHQDHLNRAAIEFRRLMLLEQRKHRAAAKRTAEACRDEWYRRQPKTVEQIEADQRKAAEFRYKNLVKAIQSSWDNVRAEVNRLRLLEWEAQEQARVRKALNEAVDLSTLKLQARRARTDSEIPTDDDEGNSGSKRSDSISDGESGSASSDGESNMSSTESEADEDEARPDIAEDEHLTQEQLREKYAKLPSLQKLDVEMENGEDEGRLPLSSGYQAELGDDFEDSDESVDMDDDMGSSDEDRDSDEDDSDGDSEDDEQSGGTSLLGFLAPSDLRAIQLQEIAQDPAPEDMESEIDETDEVSLIPDMPQTYSPPPVDATDANNPAVANVSTVDTEMPDEDTSHEDSPDDPVLEKTIAENTPTNGNGSVEPTTPELSEELLKATAPVRSASPDRSSQPTPRTTETRPSEADSASSVDLQQTSRQVTQHSTPQPGSELKTPVPFLLRGTLREYQHYGLDWLANLYANNTNGILADEMGLGKTIQTIALLAHLACEHEVWGPHLVIVPTSVMLNWEMEFKKWCPGFKILTYYGTQEERKRKRVGWKAEDSWNVCITSYQLVIQDQQVFKRRQWHYMILDEAHNIKNFQSQRWQTMLTFNTRARLLLTGTPLQNNLTELWSLLYFLMPSDGTEQGVGGFANLKEFQDWFKKPSEQILEHGREQMDDEAKAIISKLHKVLRPYLLRRLKADVEKQMPAKYEHVEMCRLSKRQRELYDGFLNREDTRGTLASGNYLSIINCLMQLRKVCNHPDLFIDRPIMTSFPMEKSAVADFEIKDLLVRRRLLREEPMTKVSLEFLNLVPTKHENLSGLITSRSALLNAQRILMDLREAQRLRAQSAFTPLDPATIKSNLAYLESSTRWGRFEELQHCVYLNALRRQQKPIYGSQLIERLTLNVNQRLPQPQPKQRGVWLNWLENRSPALAAMVPTLPERADALKSTIQKFACITPPVVARDMTSMIFPSRAVSTIQASSSTPDADPFHESRMRLSIQFPDKRLLQYDCGKLQTLDKLLRKLQAGGHRALIFTQMTKVLDILEQFLNIHGHKYLRLDGSTKIEQRQILTDRFNNDTRILAFILSSRSGGLGINLTGADTVIFYDLDWNPAMDKQCQDRCHRIGQTRDVHIYRLISEHTIEANILRKANQKRMLDDVVIQEGEFTTDYFNKMSVHDVLGEESDFVDGDAAANAAMDRVLGGSDRDKDMQRVLAQAEDREDVAAAKVAEREIVQTDAADFEENAVTATATPAGPGTPAGPASVAGDALAPEDAMDVDEEEELNAWGDRILSTDDYMLRVMTKQLQDTVLELPKDKNKSKRGRDHRYGPQRKR